MADFQIFETEQFQKDLEMLAKAGRSRMVTKLRTTVYPALRHHPHFGPNVRKLTGYDPETWRYRIGAWRFFYEVDDAERVVYMIAAAHRGSAY